MEDKHQPRRKNLSCEVVITYMNELLLFLKGNTTVIFTLCGVIITHLLTRRTSLKQVELQHKSAIQREWNLELRKIVSELNISCRVIYSYTMKSEGILGEDWKKYSLEKEKLFSRIASLQILLNRKNQLHIPLWNELGYLTQLVTNPHFQPKDLDTLTNKIVEETQDLLNHE